MSQLSLVEALQWDLANQQLQTTATQFENLKLQAAALAVTQQQILARRQELVQRILIAHPDLAYNPEKNQFEVVPAPAPAQDAKEPAPAGPLPEAN